MSRMVANLLQCGFLSVSHLITQALLYHLCEQKYGVAIAVAQAHVKNSIFIQVSGFVGYEVASISNY